MPRVITMRYDQGGPKNYAFGFWDHFEVHLYELHLNGFSLPSRPFEPVKPDEGVDLTASFFF